MRIRRGLLFWGLFLIPLGGLPLLVRAGVVQPEAFAEAWRFWPVILIVLGVAVLLGRGRAGLIGVVIAALTIGVLAGGTIASGGRIVGSVTDCANPGSRTEEVDHDGTFTSAATVSIDLDCGSVDIVSVPGADWQVHAEFGGQPPIVDASDGSLAVRAPEGAGRHRQDWRFTLPSDPVRAMDLVLNAGSSTVELDGMRLASLDVSANAADFRLDAIGATIDRLDVDLNAGRARITLAAGSASDISANAGAIELCVPIDAELRFRVKDQLTFAHNLGDRSLVQSGEAWTRAGSGDLIDLIVSGNAANLTLDPDGGCT
ncbi:hypothetical protein BH20CHL7_BH20CHL7_08110 [soil metagenome]